MDAPKHIPAAQEPYKGDTPLVAGVKSYAASVAIWSSLFAGLDLAIQKMSQKIPFREHTWARVKEGLPLNLLITGTLALFDFFRGYKQADALQQQHRMLRMENHNMRTHIMEARNALKDDMPEASASFAERHKKPEQKFADKIAAEDKASEQAIG